MDKTAQTELYRLFLVETLPEPLTPASAHVQIFDNYILNTRLRLRQVRDPSTRSWNRSLQQRYIAGAVENAVCKFSQVHLNDDEYATFESLGGPEIRKNRYFHEYENTAFAFDVFLGPLWGLNTARVEFANDEEMAAFMPPTFCVFEISRHYIFDSPKLAEMNFADIQQHVLDLQALNPLARTADIE